MAMLLWIIIYSIIGLGIPDLETNYIALILQSILSHKAS